MTAVSGNENTVCVQDYLIVSFKPFINHLYIAFKFLKCFVMLPGDCSRHFAIFTDSDLYSAAAPQGTANSIHRLTDDRSVPIKIVLILASWDKIVIDSLPLFPTRCSEQQVNLRQRQTADLDQSMQIQFLSSKHIRSGICV